MRFALILALLVTMPLAAAAQSEVELGIRSSFASRIPLAIAPFSSIDGTSVEDVLALERIVTADLEFSGVFKIQRGRIPAAHNGDAEGLVEVRGAMFLYREAPHFEGRVIDVETGQQIGAKRYRFKHEQVRQIAHHFSDEVVRMLTGEKGIASTHVVYRRKNGDRWEVVMSDYDGHNPRALLRQSVPILYPRWVDKGRALAYTSFRHGKPDLFLRNLKETSSKQLAGFDGLNYSVDWSAKRKEMLVTLSKDGNPEIYIMNTHGKIRRRLTHSRAIDVSPSWSPSGRELAFTSDRPGNPHIYIMEADGSNVRRLTFAGKYNESPAWSPKGGYIAFVSRIDGFFQLCTIRPDGTGFQVLTGDPVNHEDPRWAPNGRHLIYTEERDGESVISIIDIGTNGRRILAQGKNPDWSAR
ncbi:MAG: Tol-Pal system beta propeller repeat protein TolB [Candidatus Krumholzibacteriia bacterium]